MNKKRAGGIAGLTAIVLTLGACGNDVEPKQTHNLIDLPKQEIRYSAGQTNATEQDLYNTAMQLIEEAEAGAETIGMYDSPAWKSVSDRLIRAIARLDMISESDNSRLKRQARDAMNNLPLDAILQENEGVGIEVGDNYFVIEDVTFHDDMGFTGGRVKVSSYKIFGEGQSRRYMHEGTRTINLSHGNYTAPSLMGAEK